MHHFDEFIDSFALDLWVIYRNLSDLLEVIHFRLTVVEEVSNQICLDGVYAVLDGLVVLQGFKEFEVEGDNLALDEFCVTILLPVLQDLKEEIPSFADIGATRVKIFLQILYFFNGCALAVRNGLREAEQQSQDALCRSHCLPARPTW